MLAELIRANQPCIVLTGAGVSTESGIPDFRSAGGIWARFDPYEVASIDAFHRDPGRVWEFYALRLGVLAEAQPNEAHRALAALEGAGLVAAVVTQNVDGLHQAAGAVDVVELHGNLDRVVCLTCGDRSSRWDLDERLRLANPSYTVTSDEIRPDGDIALNELDVAAFRAPQCLVCGQDTLKPEVVFFGESVPKPLVESCFRLTDEAGALLVLGSSLKVMSGYRFVRRAAARGIPVVIITRGPTRGDAEATHQLDAPLGATLTELVRRLDPAA